MLFRLNRLSSFALASENELFVIKILKRKIEIQTNENNMRREKEEKTKTSTQSGQKRFTFAYMYSVCGVLAHLH